MCVSDFASASSQKAIIIGERIIEQNPWRNDLIRREYEIAIEYALKEHKKQFPQSQVKIVTSFDKGPGDGFKLAKDNNALGVVGYLYSTEAGEAAAYSSKLKIPYLSPVSPLASVRTSHSFSMATSHNQMAEKLRKLAKEPDFGNPSIVVLPETQLSNFEYAKAYQSAFNVVETVKGHSDDIWTKLESSLKQLTVKSPVNVLMAGFAYEQMDLAERLSSGPLAQKIRIIAPPQWNYCPRLLGTTLSSKHLNLYIVSDYYNVSELPDIKVSVAKPSLDAFHGLSEVLSKEAKIKGHDPNEPIVYVLMDMIRYALQLAEKARDRVEFNHLMGNGSHHGASGNYQFNDKISKRKVYLGKWDRTKTRPIKEL